MDAVINKKREAGKILESFNPQNIYQLESVIKHINENNNNNNNNNNISIDTANTSKVEILG